MHTYLQQRSEYTMIRTADGATTMTVCQDKAGTDESSRLAREWIGKNAGDLGVSPPSVVKGTAILHLKSSLQTRRGLGDEGVQFGMLHVAQLHLPGCGQIEASVRGAGVGWRTLLCKVLGRCEWLSLV
jgi:hypothetical protein